MTKDGIIEALSQRLSLTNRAIDEGTSFLLDCYGESVRETDAWLILNSECAPNEELLMKIESIKPMYILFGGEACYEMESESFKHLTDLIRDGEVGYEIFKVDPSKSVLELLSAMEGWDTFAKISEEEYNIISKL